MPTAENATQLVDTITRVSLSLFRDNGFDTVSFNDIASKTSFAVDVITGLFPEKEDLLAEVIWRDTKESVKAFDHDRAPGPHHETTLLDFCKFICIDRIKAGKTGRFWGLYHTDNMVRDAARQSLRRLFFLLIEDGIKQGWFKPVRAELASDLVVAMLLSALDRFQEFEEPLKMFTETLSMIGDAISIRQPPSLDKKA